MIDEDDVLTEPTSNAQPEKDGNPPLWKQVAGAVVGGTLALGLYYGYEYSAPKVTAYLTIPEPEGGRRFDLGAANIADRSLEEDERKRVVSRNMQAAQNMRGQQHDPEVMNDIDNNEYDINWQETMGDVVENVTDKLDLWEEVAGQPEFPQMDIPVEDLPPVADATAFAVDDLTATDMNSEQMEIEPEQPESNDSWDELWGEINQRETEMQQNHVVKSEAPDLPDSGVATSLVIGSSFIGASWVRYRKRLKGLFSI